MPHGHHHHAHHHHAHHHHANNNAHLMHLQIMEDRGARDTVYVMTMSGQDNQCGIVFCCPGRAARVDLPLNIIPAELQGLFTTDELSSFVSSVNQAYQDTIMPIIPCIFTHFCLPFSPVCALLYCQSKRRQLLDVIVEEQNKLLVDKRLYWVRREGFLVLKTSDPARMRDFAAGSPEALAIQMTSMISGMVGNQGMQAIPMSYLSSSGQIPSSMSVGGAMFSGGYSPATVIPVGGMGGYAGGDIGTGINPNGPQAGSAGVFPPSMPKAQPVNFPGY